MREFEKIKNPDIIEKKIITARAAGRENYLKFLKPRDKFSVCNCQVRMLYSKKLITGVKYPRLGWEHVLVRANHVPTYREMVYAKELFWRKNEIAFQIFPPSSQYVSLEAHTLHLWRYAKISDKKEREIYQKVLAQYKDAERYDYGTRKSILLEDEYFGKRVLVFGDMCWLSWTELYCEKEKFWDKEEPAFIFHLNAETDKNRRYLTIIWDGKLWDGKEIPLPPKAMV